jgi:hypothetical protein
LSIPPSVVTPTLAPWQWSWLGYTFGADPDAFHLSKIEGLDIQSVRTGDSGRSRDAGRWMGLDLLDGRDITLTGDVLIRTLAQWQALAQVLVPGGVVESPLYVNLPQWGTFAMMARVRKHTMPLDIQAAFGMLAGLVVQFSCSDPRLYLAPIMTQSVGLPAPALGMGFPLSFPFTYAAPTTPNVLTATNTGNMDVRPLVTITGPCTSPTIYNDAAPGDPYLTFAMPLYNGDRLVVDFDARSATYYTAGTSQGSSVMATLTPGSSWFAILPAYGDVTVPNGINYLRFTSQDSAQVAGTMVVQWAPAWLL